MIKKDTARCPECKESLGEPGKLINEDDRRFTKYSCKCGFNWLRPHNPSSYLDGVNP